MEAVTVDRQKLYEQVWSRPMREVCTDYGISDVGLVKVCKKLNVPRPDQGYWLAKKRRKPTPLPALKPGAVTMAVVHASGDPKAAKTVEELSADTTAAARAFFAKAIALEPIALPERIARPHRLLAGKDSNLNLTPAAHSLRRYGATRALVPRVRRILQTVFTLIEELGGTISPEQAGDVDIIDVVVADAKATFRVREKHVQERVERNYGGTSSYWHMEQRPTGLLELSIEHRYGSRLPRRMFKDSEHKKVEDELNIFIVNLARALADASAWEVGRLREEAARKKRWDEEQRRQRLRDIEAALTKDLDERAALLAAVDRMQQFLDDPRTEAAAAARGEPGAQWLAWARERTKKLEQHALAKDLPKDAVEFLITRRSETLTTEPSKRRASDGDDDDVDSFDTSPDEMDEAEVDPFAGDDDKEQ